MNYSKTFIGNEIIELVNEEGYLYPQISIKDYVESYFTSKETFGKKEVEPGHWFFQCYDFETKQRYNNEIIAVEISEYSGAITVFSGSYYNKDIALVGDPEITVKNVLSKKILQVPLRLVSKWKDMYKISVNDNNTNLWDNIDIDQYPYQGKVYTIITKTSNQFNANNIVL